MDRSSPESDRQKRGLRYTLRYYWNRTASALRSMFSFKQDTDEQPDSSRASRGSSYHDAENDNEVADALNIAGALMRRWEPVSDRQQNETPSATFRIASYNVLCQKAVEKMAHLDSSSPLRTRIHRFSALAKEITTIDADILGLQEISEPAFNEDFKPLLDKLGYGVLYSKTSLDDRSNGLVLAVKKEKFEIESQETVEYFQKEDAVLNFPNIGQIVRVVSRKTKSSMVVAHTHLLFDPLRGDTKFAQIAYLLSRVHQQKRDDEPVICIGDFNIEPSSDIYNYITRGILNATKFSLQHASGQIPVDSDLVREPEFLYELPRETFVHTMMDRSGEIQSDLFDLLYSLNTTLPNQFTHPLQLQSMYTPQQPRSVSSFESGSANPDYIFYDESCRSLHLTRRLSLPNVDDLSGEERWPNDRLPSSHIPLLAEFSLTKA